MLGRNRYTQVHVVWHPVPFHDLAFLLFRQRMENRPKLAADTSENRFSPPLGHEHNVVLAVPLGVG